MKRTIKFLIPLLLISFLISEGVVMGSGPDNLIKAREELESKSTPGIVGVVADLERNEIVALVENFEAIKKIPKEYKIKSEVVGVIKSSDPEKVRKAVESKLIAISGVSGTSHDEKSIIIYVETEDYMKAMPSKLNNIPVRCEAVGRIQALRPLALAQKTAVDRTTGIRPVLGGISLGNPYITAGTLSIIDNNYKILSNAHVIAMDENAEFVAAGTSILQPGPYDDGEDPDDKIGVLENYVNIEFMNEEAINYADAAIGVLVDPDLGLVREVLGDGENYTIEGWTEVNKMDTVRKSGRTTGVTQGRVSDTQATVKVYYTETMWAVFKDQITVSQSPWRPFIKGGDSGSLVDKDGAFIGLVFAGSNYIAVICKAEYIISELGVDVAAGPPPADTTGPVTSDVAAEPNPTAGAPSVTLTATISDVNTGGSDIAAAEYFIDSVGDSGNGTPMSASDGDFNSAIETVTAAIDVSGWAVGSYSLYVHGRDAADNWGATSSVVLSVTETPAGTLSVTVTTHKPSYKRGETVYITVKVADGAAPVSEASVHVVVTDPRRRTAYEADGTTNGGTANFEYTLSGWRARTGTYTVTATVSKAGYESGSGQTTFEVTRSSRW